MCISTTHYDPTVEAYKMYSLIWPDQADHAFCGLYISVICTKSYRILYNTKYKVALYFMISSIEIEF